MRMLLNFADQDATLTATYISYFEVEVCYRYLFYFDMGSTYFSIPIGTFFEVCFTFHLFLGTFYVSIVHFSLMNNPCLFQLL